MCKTAAMVKKNLAAVELLELYLTLLQSPPQDNRPWLWRQPMQPSFTLYFMMFLSVIGLCVG